MDLKVPRGHILVNRSLQSNKGYVYVQHTHQNALCVSYDRHDV